MLPDATSSRKHYNTAPSSSQKRGHPQLIVAELPFSSIESTKHAWGYSMAAITQNATSRSMIKED